MHLNLTTKILAIICSFQMFLLSTSIVSSDLHSLFCHDHHHHDDHHDDHHDNEHQNSPENEDFPNDEHDCVITIFSSGVTLSEPFLPESWDYVNSLLVKFFEPESFVSEFYTGFSSQRAPPLV